MQNYEVELQRRVDEAVAANDADSLDKLLREHYQETDKAQRPFDAAIQLKPEYRRQISGVALESNAAFNWANRIARAKRRVAYRLKIARGFDGLRIVSEGDSWWQYPLLLEDTIDQLSGDADKAIYSLCAAGDLVERMASQKEYVLALEESGARILLLSGGGNDLLGDGALQKLLVKYSQGSKPEELLDQGALKRSVDAILGHYSTILTDLRDGFPSVHVFGHAYDLPYPSADGKWLGKPLKKAGVPDAMRRDVIKVLLDRFSDELKDLQTRFDNFTFVDLRGKVGENALSWYDELHPHNAGFARAADEFREAIADRAKTLGLESKVPRFSVPSAAIATDGGIYFEKGSSVVVLDPGHGGSPPPIKIEGSSWNNAIGPNGTLEKTLTLDVAKRTRKILQDRGHTVLLTRDSDFNLSLADRAGVAKAVSAAVFVSIHFNASTGHNAQGTETFVHPTQGPESKRLCLAVQAASVAALGLQDRNASHPGGIKTGSFGVISISNHAPATSCVLHEVSFLDRADEETKLQSAAYRDRIAKALADGIEAYLGIGFESGARPSAPDELGDAIELAALEAGQSVMSHLGVAEAAGRRHDGRETRHLGGYMIAEELDDPDHSPYSSSGSDMVARIAESEVRYRARTIRKQAAGDGGESGEFSLVDIGEALDFNSLGVSFEADVAALAPGFFQPESTGFDLGAFEAFIEGLGLEHFSPGEFLFLGASNASGGSCAGKNTFPPPDLWPRISNTARMLDEIRRRLGAPVRILSCYRSPAYNSCVGGESASHHMKFNAVDWRCTAGDVHLWHRTAKEVRQSDPTFLGGVGLYVGSNFIHIDTRGHEANWSG
ncbi:N-acetylmuramoyl-L-alanine amidase [Mesorhizobium sp.]|uniref:N-acetylmuramoyl-L-alanine amidase n=1 Tax=Mesorhizobium sp. TaxID=1871066 RepID=UPI000FE5E748|nr:N-acetylmuramoyl-L-alanine amidase [Mesorhizobium sp.]RWO49228.1 MAG: DUF882 domain-containing protein [Mesorhizobium sp.]